MIKPIIEASTRSGYPPRTYANAAGDDKFPADVTIDFAFTPTGSGGKRGLTRLAAEAAKKLYVNVPITPKGFDPFVAYRIILDVLVTAKNTGHTEFKKPWGANIGGHELGKMRIPQFVIDELVASTLYGVNYYFSTRYGSTIKCIRSGGQTGFDEAGIKAGMALNIPTYILCPKEWNYRPDSVDVLNDESGFKARFLC